MKFDQNLLKISGEEDSILGKDGHNVLPLLLKFLIRFFLVLIIMSCLA